MKSVVGLTCLVIVGTIFLNGCNRFSNEEILDKAKSHLHDRQDAFRSLLSFCEGNAENKCSEMSFYYRTGWDSLRVELSDSLGNKAYRAFAPPNFLESMYFNSVDISARFFCKERELMIDYPFMNHDEQYSKILYIDPSIGATNFISKTKALEHIEGNWYLGFYDVDQKK